MASILVESRADINADPVLLEHCGNDVVKFCVGKVIEGDGRCKLLFKINA